MPPKAAATMPEGTKMTKMVSGGRRRVHYTFPDEGEMVPGARVGAP